MEDIVERLRDPALVTYRDGLGEFRLLAEAAEEIERLRVPQDHREDGEREKALQEAEDVAREWARRFCSSDDDAFVMAGPARICGEIINGIHALRSSAPIHTGSIPQNSSSAATPSEVERLREALEAIFSIMEVDGCPGTLAALRQIVRGALFAGEVRAEE